MNPDLFIAIKYCGIEDVVIAKYFDSLIMECLNSTPTYAKGKTVRDGSLKENVKTASRDVWIVRGYFPGTGIFYKLRLFGDYYDYPNQDTSKIPYMAHLELKTRPWKTVKPVIFESSKVQEAVMEYTLLGASTFKVDYGRKQKTMSPADVKKNATIKKRKPK
jgi:hypothetical protein